MNSTSGFKVSLQEETTWIYFQRFLFERTEVYTDKNQLSTHLSHLFKLTDNS